MVEPTKRAARSQDEQDQLVVDYLPLVNYILGRLTINLPPQIDREDLFSAGVIGLINAARNFDPDRGASFKTYAYTNVKGAILDELRRQDFVPRTQRDRIRALTEARRSLEVELGRPPRAPEIAHRLGVSVKEVDEILLMMRSLSWLSLDVGSDSSDRDGASRYLASPKAIDPADAFAKKELKQLVKQSIARLSEPERRVIMLYYQQELLLKEIGELMGISESRVSQIHSRAILHLNQEIERRERAAAGGR